MKVADAVAMAGHEVHVCRYREARTLLRWLGEDLRGLRVLDVAGGDGYWAAQARGRGARAVALDLAGAKLRRGRQLSAPPALIRGNALELPFADASFDAVVNAVSLQYLTRPVAVFRSCARVLRPGGLHVIALSHRCFPTKAIRAWHGLPPIQRLQLVRAYFERAGGYETPSVWDRSPAGADPLWIVWARRANCETPALPA